MAVAGLSEHSQNRDSFMITGVQAGFVCGIWREALPEQETVLTPG